MRSISARRHKGFCSALPPLSRAAPFGNSGDTILISARRWRTCRRRCEASTREGAKAFALPFHLSPELPPSCVDAPRRLRPASCTPKGCAKISRRVSQRRRVAERAAITLTGAKTPNKRAAPSALLRLDIMAKVLYMFRCSFSSSSLPASCQSNRVKFHVRPTEL